MPYVIPVFIPHQGCPHTCIFCDQKGISGQRNETGPDEVQEIISLWLRRFPEDSEETVQVAFYGGSFTGLPLPRQQELLGAVRPYLESGRVDAIRISTRPDYIEPGTVEFLREFRVSVVELGVQSLDDAVLGSSFRGHTAKDTLLAVDLLRDSGMEVGMQLMLGLPGQSFRSVLKTVKQTARLKPDFVRIYPVLVLRESKLNIQYARGEFRPLSLNKAIVQAAWMKKYFDNHGIRVVRMGLQPGPELENNLVVGPYHPAFGELVHGRIMLQKTRKILQDAGVGQQILSISNRDESIFRGVDSVNMNRLRELGLAEKFTLVKDANQPRFTLKNITNTI